MYIHSIYTYMQYMVGARSRCTSDSFLLSAICTMLGWLDCAFRAYNRWFPQHFSSALFPASHPRIYDLLEQAHLSLLDDLHIWHLRMRRRSLQQQRHRLEEGEPITPRPARPPGQPIERRRPIKSTYAALAEDEAQRRRWVVLGHLCRQPISVQGPFYAVHLYSGRRRTGDFHHYMPKFIDEAPASIRNKILILSIDTAVHEDMNIHSPKLWDFLTRIGRAGQVLGFLLGPPCETWSSARHETQLTRDSTDLPRPRPLREQLDCWGLLGLSRKELLQLSVGNSLLLKGLLLCIPATVHGGSTTLEHPVPRLQADRASIWRTGVMDYFDNIHFSNGDMEREGSADHLALLSCTHSSNLCCQRTTSSGQADGPADRSWARRLLQDGGCQRVPRGHESQPCRSFLEEDPTSTWSSSRFQLRLSALCNWIGGYFGSCWSQPWGAARLPAHLSMEPVACSPQAQT